MSPPPIPSVAKTLAENEVTNWETDRAKLLDAIFSHHSATSAEVRLSVGILVGRNPAEEPFALTLVVVLGALSMMFSFGTIFRVRG